MKQILSRVTENPKWVLFLYLLLALAACIQSYLQSSVMLEESSVPFSRYNNYIIFKQSFYHLIQNKDLYILYPQEHWDLFKYSPTFSLLFGLLAIQPDFTGLLCWNLLNAAVVYIAVTRLPKFDTKVKIFMLLAAALETFGALQNEQSNGLNVGMIILAFSLLERRNYLWATLLIVLSIYIKLFGIVAFALFLLYPQKLKLAAYTVLWFLVLLVLPLAVVDMGQLSFLYRSWLNLLQNDHSISYGFSVMGWLKTWFGIEAPKNIIVLIGVVLFCIPLLRLKLYKEYTYRVLLLCSVLIWVVIFNHKAEPPTFVIAMMGVVIWYFSQEKKTENLILFVLAFVFTTLAPTDIFPKFIRDNVFMPYVVKAVPCILIWLKLIYEMTFQKYSSRVTVLRQENYKAM